jgi:hypothetical protein
MCVFSGTGMGCEREHCPAIAIKASQKGRDAALVVRDDGKTGAGRRIVARPILMQIIRIIPQSLIVRRPSVLLLFV